MCVSARTAATLTRMGVLDNQPRPEEETPQGPWDRPVRLHPSGRAYLPHDPKSSGVVYDWNAGSRKHCGPITAVTRAGPSARGSCEGARAGTPGGQEGR